MDIDVGFEQIFCVDIAVDMVVGFTVDFVSKGDKIHSGYCCGFGQHYAGFAVDIVFFVF